MAIESQDIQEPQPTLAEVSSRETRDDCQRFWKEDDGLQNLSLSVFHATTHTLSQTTEVKIVENHEDKAHIKQANPVAINIHGPIQSPQILNPKAAIE